MAITLEDAITASGKYKDRLTHKECTDEVKINLNKLLESVNGLLKDLGITSVIVSSGFRPSDVNANTKGSAKKSLHMTGLAIDLADIKNEMAHKLLVKPELLKKYNLWMEDIGSTTNWLHLDMGTRTDRPLRVFKP